MVLPPRYQFVRHRQVPVTLGEGSFGLALLAKDAVSGKLVTVKLFKKSE